jgi:DNA-binding transcriptional LysR family regulator
MIPELALHSEKFFYFYSIVNEGSLQATSRKLRISAPSLSHAVKQLEVAAGAKLFTRHKFGVKLTSAGEKLFAYCRKYFRDLEDLQMSIESPEDDAQRKIKIGTFQTIALYFWPLLIDSIPPESKISLSIMTNRSKAVLESLVRREIDIALTVEALQYEKLVKHELYKDDYAFYVSTKLQKLTYKKEELRSKSILYIPDAVDENGKTLRQYVHGWNMAFRDEFELDSLEVVSEFIKKGYGIGILPTKVAKTQSAHLKAIRIEGVDVAKFGTHRFFLSYRDDLEIPQKLMRVLLDSAKRAVVDLNS